MAEAKPVAFSRTQIALHWTVAVLIAFQFLAHDGMEHLWRATQRGGTVSATDTNMAYLHIFCGCLVLVLVIWRLALRFTRGAPAAPAAEPVALRLVAAASHFALYALIIILPVSGLAAWFFGATPAAGVHVIAKTVLLPLIFLHAAGALAHHFVWKTDVLKRMLVPAPKHLQARRQGTN